MLMAEMKAVGANTVGDDPEFIVAVRSVRGGEANGLWCIWSRHSPGAEMVGSGKEHLMGFGVVQAHQWIVGGRVAVVAIHVSLRKAVQLQTREKVVVGRRWSAVSGNRSDHRPPRVLGIAIRGVALDVA